MDLFAKLRERAGAVAPEDRTKHNYYSPKNAEWVATVIDAWKKDGFAPQRISAAAINLRPQTLQLRLKFGLDYLCDGMAHHDEEVKRFFIDIRAHGVFRVHGQFVHLTYFGGPSRSLLEKMPDLPAKWRAEQIEQLREWIKHSRSDGESWSARPFDKDVPLDALTQQQLQHEFDLIDKKFPNQFVWAVDNTRARIMRYTSVPSTPVPITIQDDPSNYHTT